MFEILIPLLVPVFSALSMFDMETALYKINFIIIIIINIIIIIITYMDKDMTQKNT